MVASESRKNLIATLIGLFVAFVLVEVFGRVAPIDTGFRAGMSYLGFHPVLGFEINPALERINYETSCLDIDVSLDSGTRAIPAAADQPVDMEIAVLGDSFMLAREVGDNENFAAFLQRSLDGATVRNYGVPGYGTIQEMLAWREKAALHQPQITVLAFLDANDVADNSDRLTRHENLNPVRPFYAPDGGPLTFPVKEDWDRVFGGSLLGRVHRWLKSNLFTYHALLTFVVKPLTTLPPPAAPRRGWLAGKKSQGPAAAETADRDNKKAAQQQQAAASKQAAGQFEYWWEASDLFPHIAVYQDQPDPVWAAAWDDTERAILELQDEVREQGGHLVVLLIPSVQAAWVDITLRLYADTFGAPAPPGFDPSYPARRLEALAAQHDIDVLDLAGSFQSYYERHQIEDPYFYFRCDGHWNPVAHRLAADALIEHLLAAGIIDAADLTGSGDSATLPPEVLLGDDAASAIYGWGGVYTGDSALSE